jgi:SAM-dependent methyltransferase
MSWAAARTYDPAAMPLSTSGRPLPLPPVELRFMGESDEALIEVGDELAGLLVRYGLTEDASILDVGCGYGRLALGVLHSTNHRGPYLGFDVLGRHVEWCRANLGSTFPWMHFVHLDIRNERYNPTGVIEATRASFPADGASTDVIAMFSVFTHMYRPDVKRYLDEIGRVLRFGGVAITTWFLFDEDRLAQINSSESMFPMTYVLDEVTRHSEADNPLHAIAYEERAVLALAQAAGLEVFTAERGRWTGEPGRSLQDIIVFQLIGLD